MTGVDWLLLLASLWVVGSGLYLVYNLILILRTQVRAH